MTHRKIWWGDFSAREFDGLDPMKTIALFPTAAIEQHGPHLPVGTDTIINQGHLDLLIERVPADLDIRILPIQAIGKSNEHIWQVGTISGTATTVIDHWTQIGLEVARRRSQARLRQQPRRQRVDPRHRRARAAGTRRHAGSEGDLEPLLAQGHLLRHREPPRNSRRRQRNLIAAALPARAGRHVEGRGLSLRRRSRRNRPTSICGPPAC